MVPTRSASYYVYYTFLCKVAVNITVSINRILYYVAVNILAPTESSYLFVGT